MKRASAQHRSIEGVPNFLVSPDHALAWAHEQRTGPDRPSDEEDAKNLRHLATIYVRRAKKTFAEGGARLYRAVALPPRKPWRESLRMDRLGLYWSFRRSGAQVYFFHYVPDGYSAGENIHFTVLVGWVRPQEINWQESLLAFLNYGEDEWEARLNPDAAVDLLAVGREQLRVPMRGSSGPSNLRWRPNPGRSHRR